MEVIAHEPGGWFLVRDRDRLLLDVNCSHGAVSYSFSMELNESELAAHAARGSGFLSDLAERIQNSAPGMRGSASPYRPRKLGEPDATATTEAIERWLHEHRRPH